MIDNFDRSGYFGASDTSMVIADNRQTKTWRQWWLVKLGEMESTFSGSIYTEAGNKYEHRILKAISEEITLDRQIIIEKLKLRVNYDGDLDGTIYEVKTHKAEKDFEISKQYWRQAQVEMLSLIHIFFSCSTICSDVRGSFSSPPPHAVNPKHRIAINKNAVTFFTSSSSYLNLNLIISRGNP